MKIVHKKTETTETFKLTGKDIVDLMSRVCAFDHITNIKNFEVTVQVPGGGDWSNTRLNLDEDTEVEVQVVY